MTNMTLDTKHKGIEKADKLDSADGMPNYQEIDLFANSRLENPEEFFEYQTICPKGSKNPVPDYYIKYVEPVNSEV